MTHAKNLLLLDVGGTFIKCSDGREIPIDSSGPADAIRSAFAEAVGPFASVSGIAVAMPGPFNYRDGVFLMKHKFAAVYGENFRDVAGVPDGIELRYTHDVNGMLSGEIAYGNGRGYNRVAMVTLGTGLGFSMYIDGEILMNSNGSPLVSIFNRPFRDSVLEDYASKRGFLSTYARLASGDVHGQTVPGAEKTAPAVGTVREIGMMAAEGNAVALATFREVAGVIADAIAPILEEHGIECLLFGGQISRSFRFMEDTLRSGLASVDTLRTVSTISDFDNATFNGLRSLFE